MMRHVGVSDSMIQEASEEDSPRVRAAGQADETDTDEVEAEAEMWGDQKVGEKSIVPLLAVRVHGGDSGAKTQSSESGPNDKGNAWRRKCKATSLWASQEPTATKLA